MYFDKLVALTGFLSEGGNRILQDRIIKVNGVAKEGSADLEPVYCVLVGAGRHIQHYMGVRKGGPNAYIEANCATGAKDGFLTLKVRTRNAQGIAPRQPIVINFGAHYDLTQKPDEEEPQYKHFKGALDH